MNAKQIFDPTLLNEWQQIDPDNWRTMVSELIDLFLRSAQDKYEHLREAHQKRKWSDIADSAHALKSSCGNVGASRAQTLLNEIEHLATQKDIITISKKFKELQDVFPASIQALISFKDSLKMHVRAS